MSDLGSAPYDRLTELIEHQLQLAGEGRFAELITAEADWASLIATLPATPPASACQPLQRAALMHERLTIELLRGRELLLVELAAIERGRRTARGYAPALRAHPRIAESA